MNLRRRCMPPRSISLIKVWLHVTLVILVKYWNAFPLALNSGERDRTEPIVIRLPNVQIVNLSGSVTFIASFYSDHYNILCWDIHCSQAAVSWSFAFSSCVVSDHHLFQQPTTLLKSDRSNPYIFDPLSWHSTFYLLHRDQPLSKICTAERRLRSIYYTLIKALFDLGEDISKIVILQSAIMMSFLGGRPANYWNLYSWIRTAVTLAKNSWHP